MQLSCPYSVLTLPITCDTLLLSISPHYNIIHHQSFELEDMLRIIQQYQQTHKIVFVAESQKQATKMIQKLKQAKKDYQQDNIQNILQIQMQAKHSNDSIQQLIDKMIKTTTSKSSFLQLKCLVNKTQDKINKLNEEISNSKHQVQVRDLKISKKLSKQMKIKQKQFIDLTNRKHLYQKQLLHRSQKKKIQKQLQQQYLLSMDNTSQINEDILLSDFSFEQKENHCM